MIHDRGAQAVRVRWRVEPLSDEEARIVYEIHPPGRRPPIPGSFVLPLDGPSRMSMLEWELRSQVADALVSIGLPRQLADADSIVYEDATPGNAPN